MSLLDADIHSAHPSVIIDADAMFSEDISYFGYPSFRRSSLSRLGSSRGKLTAHCTNAAEALVAMVMAFPVVKMTTLTKRTDMKAPSGFMRVLSIVDAFT